MNLLTHIRHTLSRWLIAPEMKAAAARGQLLPQISRSNSGKAASTTWSTSTAIKDGLKASSVVFACCRIRAQNISSVPWYVEERTSGGRWRRVDGHALETLLAEPNPYWSGQDAMEHLSYFLDLGGQDFWHKVLVSGSPVELWPQPADRMKPIPHLTDWLQGYEYLTPNNVKMKLDPGEVIHFRRCDPADPYQGLSLIQVAARQINTDIKQIEWNYAGMENRVVSDGVLAFEAPLSDEQWNDARTQLKDQHQSADNARLPFVLGGKVNWIDMSHTPVEMDWLESRKLTRNEICAVFGVPVLLIDNSDGTAYNNYSTALRMLWDGALYADMDDIQASLNMSLIPHFDPGASGQGMARLRVRYDRAHIEARLKDSDKESQTALRFWSMGVPFTIINERMALGFPRFPGDDQNKFSLAPTLNALLGGPATPAGTNEPNEGNAPPEPTKALPAPAQRKSDPWPEEQKAAYWKALDDQARGWEPGFEKIISGLFASEGEAVAAAYLQDGTDAAIAAIDAHAKAWRKELSIQYQAIIADFAQAEADRITGQTEKAFGYRRQIKADPWDKRVREWVKRVAAEKVVNISRTTKLAIRAEILAGTENNDSKDAIARGIRDIYDTYGEAVSDIGAHRAFVIARTETTMAANYGHAEGAYAAAEQLDATIMKTWISSRDERVRDEHDMMDGETVALDDPYSNDMMYPGDPDGGPENVVNCRCVEAHEVTNV